MCVQTLYSLQVSLSETWKTCQDYWHLHARLMTLSALSQVRHVKEASSLSWQWFKKDEREESNTAARYLNKHKTNTTSNVEGGGNEWQTVMVTIWLNYRTGLPTWFNFCVWFPDAYMCNVNKKRKVCIFLAHAGVCFGFRGSRCNNVVATLYNSHILQGLLVTIPSSFPLC